MLPQNTTVGSTSASPAKVVPLLQALNRVEELTSAMAMRLDPITNHTPTADNDRVSTASVTGRLNTLGDTLQYLLDNIEL